MIDLSGQMIGNYQIEMLLGSGRSGHVYRAQQRFLHQIVAIKLLHINSPADSLQALRFRSEARTAAALCHPGIVQVYDFGVYRERCYLVMEYCDSGALRDHRRARGPCAWPIVYALDLARQATEALEYLHARGIVHSDISPANLLLSTPAPLTLKLADLGVARMLSDRTSASVVAGTPAYMAPEQCRGAAPDPRSDLYALGAVLYELLTGHTPYPIERLRDTDRMHAETPLSPRHWRPDLPTSIEALIARCLAYHPEQRFQDATALRRALDVCEVSAVQQ